MKFFSFYLFRIFLLISHLILCQMAIAKKQINIDYSSYQKVLDRYVFEKNGETLVDYKNLKENSVDLNNFIKNMSTIKNSDYKKLTYNEKLAFLINAYNALTLKLIIDNYPLKSIRDIGGVLSNPWKKRFFTLLEKYHYLDEIEHNIIRKDFHEPRIHFALVCASKGCPSLAKNVFLPENLQNQLQIAATNFLENKKKNYYKSEEHKLYLSSIFKWYGDDFKEKYKSFNNFVIENISKDNNIKIQIKRSKLKIEFLEYDWNLNDI